MTRSPLAEVQFATRNHGMPLEALRYDLTPAGLHYLLIHYDIPDIDASPWRLEVGGGVDRTASLSLDDLRAREAVTLPVTLECAGNGRGLLDPRPVSQPWLVEAVGTAEWTGTPVAGVLEVVFTALDHGEEGGPEQDYARSLPLEEAMRPDVLLAYRDERAATAPPTRVPAAPHRSRPVRNDPREVAPRHRGPGRALRRRAECRALPAVPGQGT